MHESLTAIRDSGDSKRGNFLEKTFAHVVISGDQQQESKTSKPGGKHQERNLSRKEKEGEGRGRNERAGRKD